MLYPIKRKFLSTNIAQLNMQSKELPIIAMGNIDKKALGKEAL
jgi:hypothetical protein